MWHLKEVDDLLQKIHESIGEDTSSPEDRRRQLVSTIAQFMLVLHHRHASSTELSQKRLGELDRECQSLSIGPNLKRDAVSHLEMKLYDLMETDVEVKTAYEITSELKFLDIISLRLNWLEQQQQSRVLSQEESSEKQYLENEFQQKSGYLRNDLHWNGPLGTAYPTN